MGLDSIIFILLKLDNFSLPLKNPVLIFSIILFIILFAPIILNKFRIPHLIGLIIAGAIIGPNGFYLVERDSSFTLFGQVGLLYIMFLAGLEIDLAEFKKNSGKSLLFGMYTFLIPMTLGIIAGIYLLDFPVPSAILLASIFASHTLIAYPMISKLGVAKNRAVNITIGGTLITDTLALLVLAAVSGMYAEGAADHFWAVLAFSVLLMGAIVMWGFPILGRWFFKRIDDNVAQYIFVLGMVFLAAFLSELAGVEPIIGAFLAGLALNKLVPHTSALMNRIEFVGNALFIPFFLIGIGMLIDYRVFFENLETLKVAAIITVVATIAKYAAAWLAQKSFGFSVDERRLIFGLSNAHVAAALAVVLVGYNTIIGTDENGESIRLLNESVLNGSIVMILVTCTIASFVAQKGARNIAINDNTNDAVDDTDIDEKILIAINDPEMANELMDLSITVKSKHNAHGLYALHVVENDDPNGSDEKKAIKILKNASEAASATDNYIHQLKRYDLNIVNGITSVIREHTITDLILGLQKDKGISERFAGNLTTGLLARNNITTLIYKSAQPLSTINRNLVIVPERAEREIGFPFWLIKLWNVSKNTGSKLVIYGAPSTLSVIKNIAQKHPVSIEFKTFTDWDDFLILGRDLKENDNLYIIMSRKNHPSYSPAMNRIPYYLNNYFQEKSFVLIYPIQTGIMESEGTDLKNPSVLDPIQENLSMLDDIGKTITRLFKKST
jgi:Kef-type K+ transport system membrane component KefB